MNNKEFHWFADCDDLDAAMFDPHFSLRFACVGRDFKHTQQLIEKGYNIILSDQSHFFSQSTIDRGYTLCAHYHRGRVWTRVERGREIGGRLITEKQNLEKLLLAGEFDADEN